MVEASSDRVVVRGRLPREGPLLVASALAAMAVVPLISPGPLTPARVAMALVLGGIAAAIGRGAVGRRRELAIDVSSGEIVFGRDRYPLTAARRFLLTTTGGEAAEPRVAYRAELELEGSTRVVVLEGTDPGAVLHDLGRLLEHLQLPVRRGWGIPADAEPWRPATSERSAPAPHPARMRIAPLPSQRRAAIAVTGGALFTTIAMSVMFGTRLRQGSDVAPLSWALAVVTVTLLYLIGLFIATDHVALAIGDGRVRVERRAFGRARSRWELPLSEVRRAYAVGPDVDEPRHVLVETPRGAVAIACSGADAGALARALGSPETES